MLEQTLLQGAADLGLVVIALLAGLLILWIAVSVPVWIAAKILTLGKARFTRAMLVTAVGPAIYAIVFFISSFALSVALGERFFVAAVSFILAFVAWLGVFKAGFDTGWLRALAIALLATIVFVIIGAIVTVALQALVPDVPPITPFPSF
ncbi:hypothetical protein [Nitrososphaera sp.]|uniref:hypothetical protein n=1 Tax=Nitrososphaera sp. TaxID=1971748 RepID=UPI00181F16A9|nr:hypothetical protein [Nitrososphaera sp.]NWG36281.1 hypothetical protein [Nitrososphaera sp.]